MAEIKVERRKKAPVWPWIIGILVLLALIWFLVEAFEQDAEGEYEEVETETEEIGAAYPKEKGSSFDETPDFYEV